MNRRLHEHMAVGERESSQSMNWRSSLSPPLGTMTWHSMHSEPESGKTGMTLSKEETCLGSFSKISLGGTWVVFGFSFVKMISMWLDQILIIRKLT